MSRNSAMMIKSVEGYRRFNDKFRKNPWENDKRGIQKCDFCHSKGHVKESYFKLNGYPDWWIAKNQKDKPQNMKSANHAYVAETPMSDEGSSKQSIKDLMQTVMYVQQQLGKLMTRDGVECSQAERVNIARFEEFAGLYIVDEKSFLPSTIHGLPSSNNKPVNTLQFPVVAFTVNDFSVWHSRMGHSPLDVLRHIVDINNASVTMNKVCEICPTSKQHRLSFL
ncbi:hypothetical protein LIER_16815 [Lithospermum erythrorhizon]|uniref:GAG-pre-integrase domain-containing protein n=1 Tax=Lithospermum erythrorhizon TaxID=34254 RepID=A0AAV3QA09_LITER